MADLRNAWVSIAVDESSALQALVLTQCLRKTVTTADIVILISKDLQPHLRKILQKMCDVIIVYEQIMKQPNSQRYAEAKLFAWQLTMYNKCVVLDPSVLVLENTDELFDYQEMAALTIENNVEQFDFSLFVIQPSYKTLEKIISQNPENKDGNVISSMLKGTNIKITAITPSIYIRGDIADPLKKTKLWIPFRMDPTRQPQTYKKSDEALSSATYDRVWWSIFEEGVLSSNYYNEDYPTESKFWRCTQQSNGPSNGGLFQNNNIYSLHNQMKNSIAIIGHSCRLPGANSTAEFWELLKTSGNAIKAIPKERLAHHQIRDERYTSIKGGFLKCPIDEFDAKFFGISPREAVFMDPQQRILLEVAWEAFENAGINPEKLKGSNTGVFTGVWTHEYELLMNQTSGGKHFHHLVLGNAFSATSARVSYFLGLNGPNIATESGCSSSLVALHLACTSLRKKETNLALATGVNLLISLHPQDDITILSRDGSCKTFDENADGFVRAEGAVVVVLKRLSDALRDGDNILSVIRGSAMSSEGTTSSFGTPSKYCQEVSIREALKVSGVNPDSVDYVEAHGTGTPIGDPVEFSALSAGYKAQREVPLIIGSVKTNIGHTEAAAGLAGLVKVVLSMENELIPSHRNFTKLNPNIDLEALPATIPVHAVQWPKNTERKRLAGLSSFGISGTNVHVILEEPTLISKPNVNLCSSKSYHILTISAKSENALKDLVTKYSIFCDQNLQSFNSVCYTSLTGRQHFKHRIAIVAKNFENASVKLKNLSYDPPVISNNTFKTAFLFTGQGCQYLGMAKILHETSPVFQQSFNRCSNLLTNTVSMNLDEIIWGPNNQIFSTLHSSIAIFCVQYCLLQVWKSFGVEAEYTLGHSVGEFAAAVAAEIITLEDALHILTERSRLINKISSGGMMVVRANKKKVDCLIQSFSAKYLEECLDIAAINSLSEVVVAGKLHSLKKFSEICDNENIKFQNLTANHAFHSRDMDTILEEFGQVTNVLNYKDPKFNYISGMTGRNLMPGEMCGDYWKNHARQTVDFAKGIQFLYAQGCNTFIEIGPQPILLALGISNITANESQKCIWLPSLRKNEDNWQTLLSSVAKLYENGAEINWEGYYHHERQKKAILPHYPFHRQKYWLENNSEVISKPIHPLLGRKVPLAIVKDTIFQNNIDLNDFAYFKDHQVANIIILPAAGFLEIILAAGRQFFNQEDKHSEWCVHNFVVEAPLQLEETKIRKLQIVVSEVEPNQSIFVRIFVFENMNGYNDEKCWKLCSSGNVSYNYTDMCSCVKKDLNIKESISTSEMSTKDFYKKTSNVGIQFGSKFQSISNIWVNKKEVISKIDIPSDAGLISEYVLHPIIIDAMIQTFGFAAVENKSLGLYLPVGVNQFKIASIVNKSFKHFYARTFYNKNDLVGCVHLYADKFTLVATMCGLSLIKTSIDSFLNVIDSNRNVLPGLYQEVYRQTEGTLHNRINLSLLPNNLLVFQKTIQDIEPILPDYVEIKDFFSKTKILCSDIIQSVFLQAGWKPKKGDKFSTQSFLTNLLFSPSHSMLVNRCLSILKEDGFLRLMTVDGEENWVILKPISSLTNIKHIVMDTFMQLSNFIETPCMKHCADNLLDVLQGRTAGLNVLFDDPDLSPFIFYTDCKLAQLAFLRISSYLQNKFENAKSKSILRIIEIGAGSGATTSEVIKGLKWKNIPFTYTFTDITPVFLEKAENKFSKILEMDYKLLNIENDPKYQGFIPYSYDIVIAANVIHATEYLDVSIRNMRQLLAPSGLVVLQEMLIPVRLMDIIFGTLDGYWRFKDYNVRKNHPCVDFDTWNKLLLENGFDSVLNISNMDEASQVLIANASNSYIEHRSSDGIQNFEFKTPVWILFSGNNESVLKHITSLIESVGDDAFVVYNTIGNNMTSEKYSETIDYTNASQITTLLTRLSFLYDVKGIICLFGLDPGIVQETFCKTMLYIGQYVCSTNNDTLRLIVITNGVYLIGDQKMVYPWKATLWGVAKTMKNENPNINCIILDLDPDETNDFNLAHQIFTEMWRSLNECWVAIRNNRRYIPKLVKLPKSSNPLTLPNGPYEVVLPYSNKIDDLTFGLANVKQLKPDEVEILVKASALNFKDILTITKPDQYFTDFNAVGMDFSGVVTQVGEYVKKFKVGDNVFGISGVSAVASHVTLNHKVLVKKSPILTFAEASTLPTVFLTAYHCLVEVGCLKAGETILIHVASGGVGLIAIQLAKHIGANIIVTAGNKRKRTYLRSLGIKHVFHSRDFTFKNEIERVTNSKGVDIVLNSLTGSRFKEMSLKSCGQNARFIEMGKINIWKHDDVLKLRPDVTYTIVNLERLSNNHIERLVIVLEHFVYQNYVKPIPYTRFAVTQIKDAFNYFLKTQHIGKVIVTMPELRANFGEYVTNDILFNKFSTYLVTGGLSGIGLEVVKWMLNCGAKTIVLVARSPPNDCTSKLIKSLKGNIITRQVDVGNMIECKDLFSFIEENLPPLRGVIHSAGSLSDAAISNQTWDKFETVFNAKVNGSWNLHVLTKTLPLEHFVLFSSMAALSGPIGQSNHSAANAFMDSLAYNRYSLGLPAQSINWGAWSEIGSATNTAYGKDGIFGVKPFTPHQGIAALKFAFNNPCVQISPLNLDASECARSFPACTNYVSELIHEEKDVFQKDTLKADEFWTSIENLQQDEIPNYTKMCVQTIVRQTLKFSESERIDDYQTFSEMGLDSLMAVEMRNKLQQIFGSKVQLNPTSLLDYPTINELGLYLSDLVQSSKKNKVNSFGQIENTTDLIRNDSILPEYIKKINDPIKPSRVKVVLLTGVTGHFGPYLLCELLQTPNVRVSCLVRSKSPNEATKRMYDNLNKFNLLHRAPLLNVSVVVGDITENNLGLSTSDFEELVQTVDAVFHCAVKTNHIEQYQISKSKQDIRSVNVLGTLEILKFASNVKTKRVYFASSYAGANILTDDGLISEELPNIDNNADGLEAGYPRTKFVGEKLMGQALLRGIPCTVFRYPTMMADSETGVFSADANVCMNVIFSALRFKIFRDIPGGWYSIPIDIAAKISASIFYNDDSETGLYNIVNDQPMTSNDFVKVCKETGYDIKIVSNEEFLDKMLSKDNPLLYIFKEGFGGKDPFEFIIRGSIVFKNVLQKEVKIFKVSEKLRSAFKKIDNYIPHPTITLKRQILFGKNNGVFSLLGIVGNN